MDGILDNAGYRGELIAGTLQFMDIPVPIDPALAKAVSLDAIRGNPANLPDRRQSKTVELAVAQRWMWKNESVLRVSFMGIWSAEVKNRVKEAASTWTRYANLIFDFIDGNPVEADIRIAFIRGYWSYIGLYSTKIPKDQPTMDLGGLSLAMKKNVFDGTVMHEFGHAIGCIHEHQSPVAGIKWNKEAVYIDYRKLYSWDRKMVDNNVFREYTKAEIRNSDEFDPESIMVYPIRKEHTLDGFEVKQTTALSSNDKKFIATMYPGR